MCLNLNIEMIQFGVTLLGQTAAFFFSLMLQEAINIYVTAQNRITVAVEILIFIILAVYLLKMLLTTESGYIYGRLGAAGLLSRTELEELLK